MFAEDEIQIDKVCVYSQISNTNVCMYVHKSFAFNFSFSCLSAYVKFYK